MVTLLLRRVSVMRRLRGKSYLRGCPTFGLLGVVGPSTLTVLPVVKIISGT